MARIRLTKKAIVLITVFLVLLIGGGAGYLIWTVNNQSKQVAPENSSAGGEGGGTACNSTETASCKSRCPGQTPIDPTPVSDASVSNGNAHYCKYSSGRECTVACGNTRLIQCCDSTWIWTQETDNEKACAGHGGYSNCGRDKGGCYCASFDVACGKDCWFEKGTQERVDQKAAENCGKKYMAFCIPNGAKTSIVIKEAGACWDKRDICKNPTAYVPCKKTNKCDTGGIDTPHDKVLVYKGDAMNITGWAADSDGIDSNSIEVKIDNTVVGKATVTGSASGHSEANAVAWKFRWTVTSDPGTHTITVSWKDKKGVGGSSCTATRTFIVKTNKCDTGGIDTPHDKVLVYKGDAMNITGWAADSDGIDSNSIEVKIDNTVVGKATVTGSASGHSEANAVAWKFRWTVTSDPGTHTITVSWKDKKGVGGSSCTGTRTFIVKTPGNNVCDTGGIDTPADNSNVQVGDVMHISGWAADSDGIDPNSIEISIDGQVVGHATVSGPASGHSEANAVAWSYDWTVAGDPGSHNLVASWRDALGNVGAGCTATRTFNIISSVVTISKTASYVCSTDAKSAKVTYVITLTNYTEQSVTVKSVIDTLDNHMPVNWIDRASISPSTGVVTDNGIEWQLGNASLASGVSRTFSYVVNIPNTSFGSFTNSVKATLTNSSVNAYKTISVVCNPNTGLFDSTERKLVAGVILIIMGTLYVVLDKDRRYSLRLTEAGLSIFTYEGKVKKTRKEFAKKFKQKR